MIKKVILFCFFCITFLYGILHAQENNHLQGNELIDKGTKAYVRGDFNNALQFFYGADSLLVNEVEVDKRVGLTLYKLNRYSDAVPYLKMVRQKLDTTDIYVDYYLAISLHKTNHFDDAIAIYESCLDYINHKKIDTGREEIEKNIIQCRFWKEISGAVLDVSIKRLDSTINTSAPEYGAKVLGDSLMFFTSKRLSAIPIADLLLSPDEDIYIVKRGKNQQWQKARKAGNNINTALNNAILDVSDDGKLAYVYSDVNEGDIMFSSFDGDFSVPDTLKGQLNSKLFTESSFSISKSGKKAFFVSNRTDLENYGGKDIFVATLSQDGIWTNIQNLGASINSKYNEDFVFYCDEDTSLYFSSDREKSVGGYDIFVSKTSSSGELLPPKNIGLPINTPFDDISYFKSGEKAWYSTTVGDNKKDIFEIHFNFDVFNPDWHKITISEIEPIREFAVVENIYFRTGQSEINMQDSAVVHLARVLAKAKGAKIYLSGHSDWVGNAKINDKLSFERAVNLAQVLVNFGVDPKMLSLGFYGESNLQTDTSFVNDSLKKQAMASNRYVGIFIEKQGQPYIYVKKSGVNHTYVHEQFGVLLYVSDKPEKAYQALDGIIESYSQKDMLYYYHSHPTADIQKANEDFKELLTGFENAYIFRWTNHDK